MASISSGSNQLVSESIKTQLESIEQAINPLKAQLVISKQEARELEMERIAAEAKLHNINRMMAKNRNEIQLITGQIGNMEKQKQFVEEMRHNQINYEKEMTEKLEEKDDEIKSAKQSESILELKVANCSVHLQMLQCRIDSFIEKERNANKRFKNDREVDMTSPVNTAAVSAPAEPDPVM
ncbi:unnamed protein product [Orchesella dallaii]|uniref:Uncharacterized protein n=1 Tax=Orchesella dallaii TaxID=48710 RepID=A0ABP1R8R2_9HEXA